MLTGLSRIKLGGQYICFFFSARIMSQSPASQIHLINKGDVEMILLALTSQLEQAIGNILNQIGSLEKKKKVSVP